MWNGTRLQLCMGVGRGGQGDLGWEGPGFWKFRQNRVIFLVSHGKNQISSVLASSHKNFEKIPGAPPGKNPSDAHADMRIGVKM